MLFYQGVKHLEIRTLYLQDRRFLKNYWKMKDLKNLYLLFVRTYVIIRIKKDC